jgi:nucleotide-binding universal stress UspA family protein
MKAILATDFSTAAHTARALVTQLTWPAGSLIEALHVLPLRRAGLLTFARVPTVDAVATARGRLRAFTSGLAAQLPADDVSVQDTTSVGDAAAEIVRRAAEIEADLLVVGGQAQPPHRNLGATTTGVVDQARCTMLVARTPAITRLMLADDGSASADAAAELITRSPLLMGLPVTVTCIADVRVPALVGPQSDISDPVRLIEAAAADAWKIVGRRVRQLQSSGRDVEGVVQQGNPSRALLEVARARKVDLIVVGTNRRKGLTRFLLGSVSRDVLVEFSGSVLIARPLV